MRNFFLLFLTMILTLGLFLNDAQAKRFGGGKSFGMQRSVNQFSSHSTNIPHFNNQNSIKSISSAKKWLAPLAGLALGGLLASLFMGNGIGSGILSWLVIGTILFLLFNLIRKKGQPAVQPLDPARNTYLNTMGNTNNESGNLFNNPFNNKTNYDTNETLSNSYLASQSGAYPINQDEFLREAKVKFIRLQAAYDQKNITDLKEFTTPDVFAEIQLQLHERGNIENKTEVVKLEAELLDASIEFQMPVASVRFSGTLNENENLHSLNEIWHFRKDSSGKQWIVSGIQQP